MKGPGADIFFFFPRISENGVLDVECSILDVRFWMLDVRSGCGYRTHWENGRPRPLPGDAQEKSVTAHGDKGELGKELLLPYYASVPAISIKQVGYPVAVPVQERSGKGIRVRVAVKGFRVRVAGF